MKSCSTRPGSSDAFGSLDPLPGAIIANGNPIVLPIASSAGPSDTITDRESNTFVPASFHSICWIR